MGWMYRRCDDGARINANKEGNVVISCGPSKALRSREIDPIYEGAPQATEIIGFFFLNDGDFLDKGSMSQLFCIKVNTRQSLFGSLQN